LNKEILNDAGKGFSFTKLALHLMQISASGKTDAPQRGQNLSPLGGLTPQDMQISLLFGNSFPQLLQ
jgi:hypothetical protein